MSVPVDSTMRSPPTEKPSVRSSSVSPTRVGVGAAPRSAPAGAMASARPRRSGTSQRRDPRPAEPLPSARLRIDHVDDTREKFCKVELSKSVKASANRTSSDVVRPWSSTTSRRLSHQARQGAGFRAPCAIARSIDAVMNACCRSIRPKSELPTVTNAPSRSS